MAVKKCCVPKCSSCSARNEDIGVSYHKFPKDISLYEIWTKITCLKISSTNTTAYVCSRHFCKSDFQIKEDSNYVLKSDAVPSIFPWKVKSDKSKMATTEVESTELNSSKDLDGDNLEDIKKFIEDEGKKVQDQVPSTSDKKDEVEIIQEVDGSKDFDERLAVASSMMDMILSESEEQLAKNRNEKSSAKQNINQGEKGNNSTALSVGSKVEARDFGEYWHPAEITEVDYEEMEVLVHYENASKKHDEWISVSSPRLRPLTDSPRPSTPVREPEPVPGPSIPLKEENAPAIKKEIKEEPRTSTEEKPKLLYEVGERCLARWRDNRRFMATITKDLGKGHYEVVFDDGFQWRCTTCRLFKLKDSGKAESLTVDTATPSASSSAPSPIQYGVGPSTPAFHTHLFDPTRDYLGSKSERREMKRKLNIKEIFNIGQKRPKKSVLKDVKKPDVNEKKRKINRKKKVVQPMTTVKTEIPDAVASIIGTVKEETVQEDEKKETREENITEEIIAEVVNIEDKVDIEEDSKYESDGKNNEETADLSTTDVLDVIEKEDSETSVDTVQEEEVKLEKFEKLDDTNHEEVIDRIKEVINKLEDGISKVQNSPKIEIKEEFPKVERAEPADKSENKEKASEKIRSKKLSKVKKSKKLRLLQEKKVKKQVEKVKSELEEMKRQVEEMRQQMLAKTEELAKGHEMPESFLLAGEWCCRWVNGQPVGKVSQLEAEVRDGKSLPGLPRRSVQVEDKRLPPGWTKHMVRRSLGNSAGKWDVVLVNSENRRFHTKTDMRNFMEGNPDEKLRAYEHVLMDFGVHLKLARRMGWVTTTPGGVDETPVISVPAGTLCSTSPLVKRRKLSLIKKVHKDKEKKRKLSLAIRMPRYLTKHKNKSDNGAEPDPSLPSSEASFEEPPLEDGYVYVGSLKVQIIENLLRCPAEGCYKNFRNNTLIKMHIKHYHRDLRKMLGRTPKVLDLAYARTLPVASQRTKARNPKLKGIKVKLPKLPKLTKLSKLPKRAEETKLKVLEPAPEIHEPQDLPFTPIKAEEQPPRLQDSPKLRLALINKPVKRPRVLLPVRRPEPPELELSDSPTDSNQNFPIGSVADIPIVPLDFETAISTHTVTKPADLLRKKEKKNRVAVLPKVVSEDEDWFTMTSDMETRSSFPRSGTPDSKSMDQKSHPISSESNEEQKQNNSYMYTETGERIKIVHMKREEIINCHCGFREEDGLMVQCELCLCWQHALCHNIQKESEVPEKYTCSICLNPRRGRRSQRFLHDQDRLYEGLLPGARPSEPLRRSHELSGNLLRIQDALHALRVKYYVATKKNHPKLYLWAKDWENGELNITQERLNSDYSELSVMMGGVGKENLPFRPDDLDIQTPPSEDHDRYSQRDALGPSLLGGLLASPGGALDHRELERLARTVQEEVQRVAAPQPEAPIENGACRERLLRHIQRCQAVLDARLDSIEAQVAELESQDPSFEDDETADYFPRTKQTIQMLMRDLDTMEELGVVT